MLVQTVGWKRVTECLLEKSVREGTREDVREKISVLGYWIVIRTHTVTSFFLIKNKTIFSYAYNKIKKHEIIIEQNNKIKIKI